jgi:ABC-2 type transport system permease protein
MGRLNGLVLYSFGFFLILQLGLVAAILYWPEFYENIESIRNLIGAIPRVGEVLDEIDETFMGYVAAQHFFKGCNTLGTAGAVLFAVGAVAGEVHRGTLEILLARPQSRARVLAERYFAGLAAFAVPILVSSATIPFLADQFDEIASYTSVLLGAVHQIVFLSTLYSVTFLFSTIGSNPTRIALGVLFGAIFCFALYWIKIVSSYSIYRLADISDFIRIDREQTLDWAIVVPMFLFSAAAYAASFACFRRRVP